MRDGQWSLALLNMIGQVVMGVAALWGGMLLAR
jgi:fluoride ion exporter CrcB/FEX